MYTKKCSRIFLSINKQEREEEGRNQVEKITKTSDRRIRTKRKKMCVKTYLTQFYILKDSIFFLLRISRKSIHMHNSRYIKDLQSVVKINNERFRALQRTRHTQVFTHLLHYLF